MDLPLADLDLTPAIGVLLLVLLLAATTRLYLAWLARADERRARAVLAALDLRAKDAATGAGESEDQTEHEG